MKMWKLLFTFSKKFIEKIVSKQQATLLNLKDIRPIILEWIKMALSLVWTFEVVEKPLSASASV